MKAELTLLVTEITIISITRGENSGRQNFHKAKLPRTIVKHSQGNKKM